MEAKPANRQLWELPPRSLNLFTKVTILFGGFFQLFGWVFFVMGSLFSWIFIPLSTAKFWFEWGKKWEEIPARIITVEPTNSSVNEEVVYSNLYSFQINDERYTGKSFTFGQKFSGGEDVVVRYNANNPEESYVVGGNRAVFPPFVLFVLIFPSIGLGFILYSLKNNWKAIRLLETGEFTRGKLMSKEVTNTRINNQPVFKYRFEFQATGKTYYATCKTHQGWLVEDEEREIILYNCFDPSDNIVFDAMSNLPAITEDGSLESASVLKVANLLLPATGIGINLYFLLHKSIFIQI